jgi:hypothetical protein
VEDRANLFLSWDRYGMAWRAPSTWEQFPSD